MAVGAKRPGVRAEAASGAGQGPLPVGTRRLPEVAVCGGRKMAAGMYLEHYLDSKRRGGGEGEKGRKRRKRKRKKKKKKKKRDRGRALPGCWPSPGRTGLLRAPRLSAWPLPLGKGGS